MLIDSRDFKRMLNIVAKDYLIDEHAPAHYEAVKEIIKRVERMEEIEQEKGGQRCFITWDEYPEEKPKK